MGEATLIAIQHFALLVGEIWSPVIIRARKVSDGYQVAFVLLPEDLGEEATVFLSADLRWYAIDPDPAEIGFKKRNAFTTASRGGEVAADEKTDLVIEALSTAFEYD